MTAPLHIELDERLRGGTGHWAAAADGVRTRFGLWQGGQRGTLLALTGRAECVERYGDTVSRLTSNGFCVAVAEMRGQGLSDRTVDDRLVGHVDDFSGYQMDVAAVLAHPALAACPEPRVLMGHSMGGAVGWRALLNGLDVSCAVFVAPMLGIALSRPIQPVARHIARLAVAVGLGRRIVPGGGRTAYPIHKAFPGNVLTRDRDEYMRHRRQLQAVPDLQIGGPSFGWMAAALREIDAIHNATPFAIPSLLINAGADAVVDQDAIRRAAARLPNGRLVDLPEARHGVLMETAEMRDAVWAEIDRHLDLVSVP